MQKLIDCRSQFVNSWQVIAEKYKSSLYKVCCFRFGFHVFSAVWVGAWVDVISGNGNLTLIKQDKSKANADYDDTTSSSTWLEWWNETWCFDRPTEHHLYEQQKTANKYESFSILFGCKWKTNRKFIFFLSQRGRKVLRNARGWGYCWWIFVTKWWKIYLLRITIHHEFQFILLLLMYGGNWDCIRNNNQIKERTTPKNTLWNAWLVLLIFIMMHYLQFYVLFVSFSLSPPRR